MAKWNLRSKRKITGGKLSKIRKKRKLDRRSKFLDTRIGQIKHKTVKKRGGSFKVKILSQDRANVSDPETKKSSTTKILSVQENPANPHYARRNVMTKGAIIKTELGLARVTSSPGQHGTINAILLEKNK